MPIGAGDMNLTINIFVSSDVSAQVNKITKDLSRFGAAADEKVKKGTRLFSRLGSTIGGAAKQVTNFAKRYTAMAAAMAGAAVIFKSVSDAQKFGIAIAEISTIFDATPEALAEVERSVLSLSEALGLPEQIVAKGFYQIISSDITDAADAMLVLSEGTQLATVGLSDVKQTVNVLTSIIKAYQRPVEDAAAITNVLFRTVIKGKTTIPELSGSLGQLLPIAATLGVSLEEVSAAIATLTQGGIETNTSMIQLRQAMNQLLKPSSEGLKVMREFGLEIGSVALKRKGFVQVLDEIREKIGNNAGALSKLFGNIRGLTPILALTGKQAAQFAKNFEFISESFNKVDEASEKFLKNPFKRFQIFFNAIRIKLRAVGEVFIRGFVDQLDAQGGIQKIVGNFEAAFGSLESAAATAARAIGGVFHQLEVLVKRFGGLENAGKVFELIGTIVSETINVVFQTSIALVSRLFELLARIPEMVRAAAAHLSNAFAGIPLFGVDLIRTKRDLEHELDEVFRAALRSWKDHMKQLGRDVDTPLDETFRFVGPEAVFDPAVSIFKDTGVLASDALKALAALREEYERAPQHIEDMDVAMGSLLDGAIPAAEAIVRLGTAVADLSKGFTKTLTLTGSDIARLFEVGDFEKSFGDIGDTILERLPEVKIVPEFSEEDRVHMIQTLGKLQTLAEDFGIKIDLFVDPEKITPDFLQHAADRIDVELDLPVKVSELAIGPDFFRDSEAVTDFYERIAASLEMQLDLLGKVEGTEQERLEVSNKLQVVRDREVQKLRDGFALTEKMKNAFKDVDALASRSRGNAILGGFTTFEAEFAKASRGLSDTIEKQEIALEKTNNSLRTRFALLEKEGRFLGGQYKILLGQLLKTEDQLADKKARKIFGQNAFQQLGAAENAFLNIEQAAKEATLAALDFSVAVTPEQVDQMSMEYTFQLEKMLADGDKFQSGFSSGWSDMTAEMGNSFANGIRTANEALAGFQNSFSSALADFISGATHGSEAWEAFKESLATSFARALSNAIADEFTAGFAKFVTSIFQDSVSDVDFGEFRKANASTLNVSGPEVEAQAVGAATATAVTTSLTPFVTELGTAGGFILKAAQSDAAASTEFFTAAGVQKAASLKFLEATIAFGAMIAKQTGAGLVKEAAGIGMVQASEAMGAINTGSLGPPSMKIPGVDNLASGGIRSQETFARIAEAGTPEAVVPLPGDGRSIPVQFKDDGASRMNGGGIGEVHVNTSISLSIESSGDPTKDIKSQAREIETVIETALVNATNRGLKTAVRRAAGGL